MAKRIVFPAIADRQTRLLAMKNGDIDGTFDLAISDIDQWKALGNVDIITAPSLGIFLLTLDQSAPPFDDLHVRKAIAYAIDRDGLVKALLKGNGEPAMALNPPEMWSGVLPAEAGAGLLRHASRLSASTSTRPRPSSRNRSIPTASPSRCPARPPIPTWSTSCRASRENLKQIGIKMTVQEIDGNQWLAGYFRHEKHGHADHALLPRLRRSRRTIPYLFFDSANAAKDGMNGSNYKNPAVDKLLATANQNADPKDPRRGAEAGLQDRGRRCRGRADLLAGLGGGDQQQVQAHRLQRLLVQHSVGDPRLRPEIGASQTAGRRSSPAAAARRSHASRRRGGETSRRERQGMDRLRDCVARLDRLRHPSDLSFTRGGRCDHRDLSAGEPREAGESFQSRLWRFGLDGRRPRR